MYTVKRTKKFKDKFRVLDENDNETILEVEIDIDKMFNDFHQNWRAMELANIEIERGSFDYKKLGNAVIALITVVFGKKNTDKLLSVYGANYIELVQDVIPYIADVIKPEFDKQVKVRQKANKQKIKDLLK